MPPIHRRQLLGTLASLPLVAGGDETPSRQRKIVVTGGHPGDPEYGCGGTIARCTSLGHEFVLLYLNDGVPQGKPRDGVRIAEAQKACEILKARPIFAGQIDGDSVVDRAHYDAFRKLLEAQAPDVVFTHWPIVLDNGSWNLFDLEPFRSIMTKPITESASPPSADEVNRLWQHGMHEERLFHDRMNFFSAMQVGLLGVFAILYHKEPSPGVFFPLTAVALALTLLWLIVQVRHWRYCVHVNDQVQRTVPEYSRTVATYAAPGRKNGLWISRPLAYAVPLLFALAWVSLFVWVLIRSQG